MEQEKICGTCKYFAQHYRKWGKGYHEVDCGHCKDVYKRQVRPPSLIGAHQSLQPF